MKTYAAAYSLIFLILLSILPSSCTRGSAGDVPTRTASPPTMSMASPTPRPTLTVASEPSPTLTPAPPTEPSAIFHAVGVGDTLLGLAQEYAVPMAAIQLRNGMADSTVVRVGEILSIPSQVGWEGASPFWIVHVVKAGQTLTTIARAYALDLDTLRAVNGLNDADSLDIGQQLVLPLDVPAVALAPTATATPTPPPTATPPPATVHPTASLAPPPQDVAAWPHEVARLINEVRSAHGLGPFGYDETLAQAAQAHANDCAQRGWCSHTGSDGSDVKTRILRAGYEPSGWAECWVQAPAPQQAVEWWMDEVPPDDAHRRTLLSTWVSELGVGVAKTTWGYYIIADFGRP